MVLTCKVCKSPLVVKKGKYGKFMACPMSTRENNHGTQSLPNGYEGIEAAVINKNTGEVLYEYTIPQRADGQPDVVSFSNFNKNKKEFVPTRVRWDLSPDWANYITMNENGRAMWHETRPSILGSMWTSDGLQQFSRENTEFMPLYKWKESSFAKPSEI